ncbi:MAG: DUF1631 family protein [Gammaproteobacteria bacterium]
MASPKQLDDLNYDARRSKARAMGTGRRTYVRYPLVLEATLVVSQKTHIPCEMRDFCLGGMLLHYKPQHTAGKPVAVGTDEVVTVHCIVPDGHGEKLLKFQARVAHAVEDGVGVAFIDPDRESLQEMQRIALQLSLDAAKKQAEKAKKKRRGAQQSGALGRRYDDVIDGCGRIVQDTMNSMLEKLGAGLTNHLLELSRDSVSTELQNSYFDASELLRQNSAQFLNAFRSNFQQHMRERVTDAINHKESQEHRSKEITLEGMSLIEDDDLAAWLAVSEVATKAEEQNKGYLDLLEERLSAVFGMPIGRANNPYGPALFAESFQVALGQYQFPEAINIICYEVLREMLFPTLSGLYDKLNTILVDCGILPNLKPPLLAQPKAATRKPQSSASSEPSAAPNSPTKSEGGRPFRHAAAGDPKVEASYQPAPSGQSGSAAGPVPSNQQWPGHLYQLIRNLQDMRRLPMASQRPTGSGDAGVAAGVQQGDAEATARYSTAELVDAVADLQVNGDQSQLRKDLPLESIKSRVLAALDAQDNNHTGKAIDPRDSSVMEVTSDLLDSMQDDPLVAASVKPWLKQLELPVLKLALQDPSLFFDQSHVARQVVNSIAQLEFYQEDDTDSKLNSISIAIERLLDQVATERSNAVEIFSAIQSKLNKLVNVQNMAYAENVKDVVKTCQENLPIPEVYESEAIGGGEISDSEMRKWLMFARRLREGDDVIFSPPTGKPQRLRVAWMDEHKNLYVFVNLRGIQERVMRVFDVARMIRVGMIEPQGNAVDPAMDRAQYSVMQNLYKQVVYENTHDTLTHLVNRREFTRRVDEALMHAKRDDKRHALLDIDLDQFSAINANCGYAAGDELLKNVAEMLGRDLDGKAEIARLGSDQFGVLLAECSLDDALAWAEWQIEDIANYKLDWEGNQYSISLSVGIVPISARSGSVDELMQAAEASRNFARESGGNRLQLFHAGHARGGHQAELKKWAASVDRILKEDSLEIRCQRIQPIGGDSGLHPHYEILLGVKNEQGDVASPVEFIKWAELSRKMSTVDRYVVTKALRWMNDNAEVVDAIAGFNINLSGESLNEEGFVDFILEQLQGVRIPYEKICFEVTETVGVTSLSDATLGIERIKDAGCRFALDDFGSGMSSYGYLKNLPVDMVKIDGGFVKDLVAESSDYVVVKSITEIAHFMKKIVVAEYVESEEIFALLREIGVDFAQGYMIDRPGSLDRLASMHLAPGA